MAFSRRLAASILLFLVLIVASEMEMMKVVEARLCGSPSITYTDPCLDNAKCNQVCQSEEKFDSGSCMLRSSGPERTMDTCVCFKRCC